MRVFKNLIGIAILTLLVLGIINFKEKIKPKLQNTNVWQNLSQRIEIFKHNLSFTVSPQRRRPFNLPEREAKLIHVAPDALGKFRPDEWRRFWNAIYEPIKEKQGSFMVKRYRTQREIEDRLKHSHPKPFTYFTENHWSYFWSIVLEE